MEELEAAEPNRCKLKDNGKDDQDDVSTRVPSTMKADDDEQTDDDGDDGREETSSLGGVSQHQIESNKKNA